MTLQANTNQAVDDDLLPLSAIPNDRTPEGYKKLIAMDNDFFAADAEIQNMFKIDQ
ncbi:hypothetical protein [Xenorhabdus hominickii]|uniref:Uncharacterized protein n=1 Tax=Xenorhabdus hominickii TaxID=351679 RepID=A0A2G0Q047_XENHO|nr:hypothetical protein [Xenorhabdus hominickii]PHM52572.1 hypothetical protein Xhom_04239 [Xenorhabdus hominickii]